MLFQLYDSSYWILAADVTDISMSPLLSINLNKHGRYGGYTS